MPDLPHTYRDLRGVIPPRAWVARDDRHIARLAAAREAAAAARECADEAERHLVPAVCDAWVGGNSWRVIGLVLGVSRQAAFRRYGVAVQVAWKAHERELDAQEQAAQEQTPR
jgi:hypothetical protein